MPPPTSARNLPKTLDTSDENIQQIDNGEVGRSTASQSFQSSVEIREDSRKSTSNLSIRSNSSDEDLPLLTDELEDHDGPLLVSSANSRVAIVKKGHYQFLRRAKELLAFSSKDLRHPESSLSEPNRHIKVELRRIESHIDERTKQPYIGNSVHSNKYTPLTFVPRQLVAQFSKLANAYFLCFAILQLIPGLSTIGNKTNIIPLSIFVSISMAKEGFEDFRRHRLDREENQQQCAVIDQTTPSVADKLCWRASRWRDLKVGDIIKLERDQLVPADVVLLHSRGQGQDGEAFVETAALDGETDLKIKRVAKNVLKACPASHELVDCSIEFIVESPKHDLYDFRGSVVANQQRTPLTSEHIIYRGSVVRNISQVVAMIVYSGEECKIRMNANMTGPARVKAPRLQSKINQVVLLVACIVVGLSAYNTIQYQMWKSNVERKLVYLSSAHVPIYQEIFGFIIMFATMVPLSLYVSLEMIKMGQIYFLNSDSDMYDAKSNIPFEARTSTINEELGQVTHVFSDKTGTLTTNEMEFQKMWIAGSRSYHEPNKSSQWISGSAGAQLNSSEAIELLAELPQDAKSTSQFSEEPRIVPKSMLAQRLKMMLLCMSLCHSCIPERNERTSVVDFHGPSPDEVALLKAAGRMGIVFSRRTPDTVVVEHSSRPNSQPSEEAFEILGIFEFTNVRKRMSVVVRLPDQRIVVICKGADTVILERLRSVEKTTKISRPAEQDPQIGGGWNAEDCIKNIDNFANEGLRTLVYAYRFLTEDQYLEWKKMWDEACSCFNDRDELTQRAADLCETDLELIGVTAIEDRLQEGVPQTLERLCRANIKICMLTGDKAGTAINIARSCGLINESSAVLTLYGDREREDMERGIASVTSAVAAADHSVVVIEGSTLAGIYREDMAALEAMFLDMIVQADSVICCRAQPSQKAQLVNSVRQRLPSCVTLAIGDGANDVAMIQQAHIGIGITGKEGSQASRCSDYSIGQFRFLDKLLFVHGRWNYIRTCKYVLGTLWKEVLFFLPQALFQRWNGFTGTSLYEPWTLGTYNTIFTSLPVMMIGVFDKDLSPSTLLAMPELYRSVGQSDRGFNIAVYVGWTAMGVAESLIVYFGMLFMYARAELVGDNTLFPMGNLDFVAVVIIVSVKLQVIEMYDKTIVAAICMFLSIGAAFLWNMILAATYPLTSVYKAREAFFLGFGRDLTWWLTLIWIVVCVYLFESIVILFRKMFFPTEADTFQELEQSGRAELVIEDNTVSMVPKTFDEYRDRPDARVDSNDIALQEINVRTM